MQLRKISSWLEFQWANSKQWCLILPFIQHCWLSNSGISCIYFEVSRLSFHYICAVAINLTLSESSYMNVHQVFFKEPCGKSYKEQLLVYWIMWSTLVTTLVFSTDIRICRNNSINGGRLEKTDSFAIGWSVHVLKQRVSKGLQNNSQNSQFI